MSAQPGQRDLTLERGSRGSVSMMRSFRVEPMPPPVVHVDIHSCPLIGAGRCSSFFAPVGAPRNGCPREVPRDP